MKEGANQGLYCPWCKNYFGVGYFDFWSRDKFSGFCFTQSIFLLSIFGNILDFFRFLSFFLISLIKDFWILALKILIFFFWFLSFFKRLLVLEFLYFSFHFHAQLTLEFEKCWAQNWKMKIDKNLKKKFQRL